jgi:hypothetical protein
MPYSCRYSSITESRQGISRSTTILRTSTIEKVKIDKSRIVLLSGKQCCCGETEAAWLERRDRIPPPDGKYYTTWQEFQEAFRLRFVPEIAITLVRKELGDMKFKRGEDILRFNNHYAELLGMLNLKTSITRNDALYDGYVAKFPETLQAQIVVSARMQKKLAPTLPFTLEDAMELVAEAYAEGGRPNGTGSLQITAPRPLQDTGGPQPMDLSSLAKPPPFG